MAMKIYLVTERKQSLYPKHTPLKLPNGWYIPLLTMISVIAGFLFVLSISN